MVCCSSSQPVDEDKMQTVARGTGRMSSSIGPPLQIQLQKIGQHHGADATAASHAQIDATRTTGLANDALV